MDLNNMHVDTDHTCSGISGYRQSVGGFRPIFF